MMDANAPVNFFEKIAHTVKIAVAITLAFGAITARAQTFELRSPDFGPSKPFTEKFLFTGMGCGGGNVSPALSWENPPPGTRSFALMVHDPDAVTGGAGIWHWVIVNIPATARFIEQGAGTADGAKLPAGSRQISNDYAGFTGAPGWGGPCPPKGHKAHSYNFTLYALGVDKVDLPPTATASHAGFLINREAVGRAILTGTYGR
jgi:Raf kinase inhibitor-like YbhB/YbcL family protein